MYKKQTNDSHWLKDYIKTGVWKRKFIVFTKPKRLSPPLPPASELLPPLSELNLDTDDYIC